MPFQDIDDEAEVSPIPRTPSAFERVLRKTFLEDWGLKLLALVITLALWLAVTGQNKPVTLRVPGVQMNFLEGVTLQGFHPATIPIRLEPRVDAQLEVEVKFEGTLPEGYELGS